MLINVWLSRIQGMFSAPGGRRRQRIRRQGGLPGPPAEIQLLEVRILLTESIMLEGPLLVVPGTSEQTVQYRFDFTSRKAAYKSDVGVYIADDASGRVGGQMPGSPGFMKAVLTSPGQQLLFARKSRPGASKTVTFHGGDHISFYLIQNNTEAKILKSNPLNLLSKKWHTFFADVRANPDGFDHLKTSTINANTVRLRWEDQTRGGDRDFDDFVMTVSQGTPQGGQRPAITSRLTNDTGRSATDRITSDPTVQGTVANSSALTSLQAAFDRGASTPVFQNVPNRPTGGAFSLSLTDLTTVFGAPLTDGNYRLLVRALNGAGSISDNAVLEFTLDTAAPVVNISSPTAGLTTNAQVTVSGTVTDALTGVATLQARIDAGAPIDVTFDSSGNFQLVVPLPLDGSADGPHTVSFFATDRAGNTTAPPASVTFKLDATAPLVVIQTPDPDSLTRVNLTFVGQATDNLSGVVTLQAQVDSGAFVPVTFDATGNYQFTTSLPADGTADGVRIVRFRATDAAGNVSALTSRSFTLDTTPPSIAFDLDPASDSAPVGDRRTTASLVTLVGQTEPGLSVTLLETGAQTQADASGIFSFAAVALEIGANGLTVRATDPAGNLGFSTQTFTRI